MMDVARCSILDTGCGMLGARSWMMDAGCWLLKSQLDPKLGSCGSTIRTHTVFNRYWTFFVFSQRRLDDSAGFEQMPVHDREILLFDVTAFPKPAQFARRVIAFGHECMPAGFAVEVIG